jgi:hypothetical protein
LYQELIGMLILSISELQVILEPHLPRFSGIIWPVLNEYEEDIPSRLRIGFGSITQATVIHSLMVANARREFLGVDGVTLIDGPNESLYVCVDGLEAGVDGSAICQFKKLDDSNKSRNSPTRRQYEMRSNEPLPGVPPQGTFVDAGYVLNDLGTVIRTVPLVRLRDQKLIFEIPQQKNGQIRLVPPISNPPLPGLGVQPDRFKLNKGKEGQGSGGKDVPRE